MTNSNYLTDHILYKIFKIILNIIKKHETLTDSSPIRIYINKIESRITCTIKTRLYLQLLTSEIMKLLGSTKNKINKDTNGENVPHFEIT